MIWHGGKLTVEDLVWNPNAPALALHYFERCFAAVDQMQYLRKLCIFEYKALHEFFDLEVISFPSWIILRLLSF
jgi:hypothetical protein